MKSALFLIAAVLSLLVREAYQSEAAFPFFIISCVLTIACFLYDYFNNID